MKKLLIILLGIAIFQSCTVKISGDNFYLDEDFALIDKYEKEVVINGYSKTIRTWKIVRFKTTNDSIFVGIINNTGDYNGCGHGIITDELWKSREIGAILHFDYINKNRFHKEKKITAIYTGTEPLELYSEIPVEIDIKSKSPVVINMNKLEVERRIMEIEREIMSLERELETLKESQK